MWQVVNTKYRIKGVNPTPLREGIKYHGNGNLRIFQNILLTTQVTAGEGKLVLTLVTHPIQAWGMQKCDEWVRLKLSCGAFHSRELSHVHSVTREIAGKHRGRKFLLRILIN